MKVWNQLSTDKQRQFQKHKLLVRVFNGLKETEPVSFQEVKIVSLLWVSIIQCNSSEKFI